MTCQNVLCEKSYKSEVERTYCIICLPSFNDLLHRCRIDLMCCAINCTVELRENNQALACISFESKQPFFEISSPFPVTTQLQDGGKTRS